MAKITSQKNKIAKKIQAGSNAMKIAVTEAVIEYGNIYVREDQGTLKDSALIASRPSDGLAIWETPYAKKVYYTGVPSKDVNHNASLMWAEKGVNTNKKEVATIAQKSFTGGIKNI